MSKPVDDYRRHFSAFKTVTFAPWNEEGTHTAKPGRTVDDKRRRPKRVKPNLYEYEDPEQEKLAFSQLADHQRNTMARPRDYTPTVKATTLRTEESLMRTPALPDPKAPEEDMVHKVSADELFEAMADYERAKLGGTIRISEIRELGRQALAEMRGGRQKKAADSEEPTTALGAVAPAAGIAKGVGLLASNVAGAGLPIAAMRGQAEGVTSQMVPKLLEAAKHKGDIPIRDVPHWTRSHFSPGSKFIRERAAANRLSPFWQALNEQVGERSLALPTKVNPFVAAHEVGHATGSQRLLKASPAARLIGGLGGAGLLAHAIGTAEKGEDLPVSAYLAPAVASIGPATRQAEELRATLRGIKLLRRAGIPTKNLLRQAAGQQAGYLAAHLGKIAPFAAGAYALKKYVDSPKEQEKGAGLLKRAEGDSEEGGLPSWLPAALAGAGGLGAYALARHPFKGPKGSTLAKIRELSGGRMVRGDVPLLAEGAPWHKKLLHGLRYGPTVDPDDPAQIARLLKEQKKGIPTVWGPGDEMAAKGTFNPALGPDVSRKAQLRGMDIVEDMDDKLLEAGLLQKYAPGTAAKTLGIGDILDKYNLQLRKGKNLPGDLAKLQEALKKEFGDAGYLMKTRSGQGAVDMNVASSGVFPTEKTDLVKSYEQWRGMRPEFQRLAKGTPKINEVIEKFRTRPGYEGRVVDEALRDNVILQEKLDLERFGPRLSKYMKSKGYGPTREFRVHVLGGKAVPSMAMPRYPTPAALLDYVRARKAAKWAQKNVLDKLPESHRAMAMGMDVAPIRGGGYRVIETNTGGASGLLDNPITTHQLHKAVTGRYSKPAAGVLAGAGAVGGAGAGLLAQRGAKEEVPAPLPR